MAYVRSLIFNIAVFFWIVFCLLCLGILLAMPVRYGYAMCTIMGEGINFLMRHILNLNYKVRGEKYAKTDVPVIYAPKHQSAWDIVLMYLQQPKAKFVLKQEIMNIPFFGRHSARFGMIPINRKEGARALVNMIKRAQSVVDSGTSLIIFPEGTRTDPGEEVAYQRGITALYEKLNIPVVPIALNSGYYWGRRKFLKKPGMILVEYQAPIKPGLPREEFMKVLHDRLEGGARKLQQEAEEKKLAA
jgi:1-acyl-sn-glycerol-3-phosphate acyltransferase